MTFAVAGVRFEPQPGLVRLLKELFQIIPVHMIIREIIPGRKQRAHRCPVSTVTVRSDIAIFVLKRDVKLQLTN